MILNYDDIILDEILQFKKIYINTFNNDFNDIERSELTNTANIEQLQ